MPELLGPASSVPGPAVQRTGLDKDLGLHREQADHMAGQAQTMHGKLDHLDEEG
jgi:hypothetical protein